MQTRRQSMTEAVVNVGSGMIIAFVTTQLLSPILGIKISYHANIILTIILTCVSVGRGYFWRRYFNNRNSRVNTSREGTNEN